MTLDEYLQQHYTEDTARAYQREITIFLSNYPAAAIAAYKDITHYIGLLRKRYSNASTLNRILAGIKVYYDYLCSEGIRQDHPAKSIVLKDQRSRDIQLQDLFTTAELENLLNRSERYAGLEHRNKVLISLCIYQALHPAELEALRITDVNLAGGTIAIRTTPRTNARELSLKPNQVLLFYEYLNEVRPALLQHHTSNVLLIGIRAEAMKAGDITKHVKRIYAGLYPGRNITVQTIRQSVIANLLKQGHDISLVQQFAGHKYPGSTEQYKQSEVATLQAAVNKYHPFI